MNINKTVVTVCSTLMIASLLFSVFTIKFVVPIYTKQINYLTLVNKDVTNTIEILSDRLAECKKNQKIIDGVTITMYQPVKNQTDNDPHITADGTKINVWRASELRFVAASRDLLKKWGGDFEFGDYIYLPNIGIDSGVYQIKDTMNKRFKKRIDILRSRGNQRKFKYTNVKAIKLELSTL